MSLLRQRVLLGFASAGSAAHLPASGEVRDASSCVALAALLYAWLCVGLIAALLFPVLRGNDPMLGWWPFWLVLWPATSLALLCWRRRICPAGSGVPR